MANLTSLEKIKLEKFFDMRSGYVLNFSNRTIQEFVVENANKDLYSDKYNFKGDSKANRVRAFWEVEPSPLVGKLIESFLEYWKTTHLTQGTIITSAEQALFDECLKIAEKLKRESIVEDIDALTPNTDDKNFLILSKSIKESIERNEPENAIDRLHTFIVKYTRELCDKYAISYDKDTPLHSLFGGYIKYLRDNGIIESQMTERILKSSISVLEAFNDVRNNKSLAHDNQILNYSESVLIFNDIANVIKFIESIESKKLQSNKQEETAGDIRLEDIPF